MSKPVAENVNQLMYKFMKPFDDMDEDFQAEVWTKLNEIVDNARLKVVEDAEKAIGKLRVFSL